MGFDNECIVNIQSLPGEYFCPVCRHLVYPNEALQALCTHLYCKPCLTYVASTTRACPYDGYLVTEADSKPLLESNKTLAETIGKSPVLCLYHKSGCAWQGHFSDCMSHCSVCAFGNSPVVCNRCGVQMVHRQTQEHVQNCPGVNTQAQQAASSQDASAGGNVSSTDQSQNLSQAATVVSQATTVGSSAGPDSNQPVNSNSQNQSANQSAVQPTAEQWYQQQQQYQQFYQQYPGYDPYQQQYQYYYPYQQPVGPQYQHQQMPAYGGHPQPHVYFQNQPQTLPQYQTQVQAQPQNVAQSQPHVQTQQHSRGQASLTAPPHNQAQVHSAMPGMTAVQSLNQPQTQVQMQPQPPSHIYPPAQAQAQSQPPLMQAQPQQQVQMAQYQQPQVQNPPPQLAQNYPASQPQSLPQMQPHAPVQNLAVSQSNQPPKPKVLPQMLPASANAVTGHQSYPQPQQHVQMHQVAPQVPVQAHHQAVPQSISQPPVQMQGQFPQQAPLVRPYQSHSLFPNHQQPASLPSVQVPPVFFPPSQQPSPAQQCPGMQPQQPVAQPFAQQQLPVPSQSRPQTPLQSSLQYSNSYPQLPANPASSHSVQPSHPQSSAGRPILPPVMPQSHMQSSAVGAVRSVNAAHQFSGNQHSIVSSSHHMQMSATEMSKPQGWVDKPGEFNQQQAGCCKTLENDGNIDAASGHADTVPKKPVGTEFDQNLATGENKHKGEGQPGKEISESTQASVKETMSDVLENVDPANSRHPVKGESAGSTLQPLENNNYGNFDKKIQHSPLMRKSNGVETRTANVPSFKLPKEETGILGPATCASYGPVPLPDQGKHQPVVITSGPMSMPSKPAPRPGFPPHPSAPGLDPTQFTNQGPGALLPGHTGQPLNPAEHLLPSISKQPQHPEMQVSIVPAPGSLASYGRETIYHGASMGPYDQTQRPDFRPKVPHGESIQRPHVGVVANLPHEMEGHHSQQRPSNLMDSELFPNEGPGYMNGPTGFPEERMKHFSAPHNVEFENNVKKLPRSSHFDSELVSRFGSYPSGAPERVPHALHNDGGLKLNSGAATAASRMFPPHISNELRERPIGFNGENEGKFDAAHGPPDYLGPGPGYGHHPADGFTHRNRVGEYPGMSSRRAGLRGGLASKSVYDDFDSRHSRHLADQVFHDSRLPPLPGHLCKGEFDNAGNLRLEEHIRGSDFIGKDGLSGHMRRGDHMGPQNLPRHLQFGDPHGFGPGSLQLVGRGNGPGYPRFGEPGFRSRFSMHGFPNDGGFFAGDESSFESFRKRKPTSMGWCRICKVDCETVEGLDLHSQTREHQKVAMDIVKNIKLNAKKKKLASTEAASADNASKPRNTGFESRGNKN